MSLVCYVGGVYGVIFVLCCGLYDVCSVPCVVCCVCGHVGGVFNVQSVKSVMCVVLGCIL